MQVRSEYLSTLLGDMPDDYVYRYDEYCRDDLDDVARKLDIPPPPRVPVPKIIAQAAYILDKADFDQFDDEPTEQAAAVARGEDPRVYTCIRHVFAGDLYDEDHPWATAEDLAALPQDIADYLLYNTRNSYDMESGNGSFHLMIHASAYTANLERMATRLGLAWVVNLVCEVLACDLLEYFMEGWFRPEHSGQYLVDSCMRTIADKWPDKLAAAKAHIVSVVEVGIAKTRYQRDADAMRKALDALA